MTQHQTHVLGIQCAPFEIVQIFKWRLWITLATPNSLCSWLQQKNQDAKELSVVLQQYPWVRYQPLDDFYQLRSFLNRMHPSLIEDLLYCYTYKGAVYASLLLALQPDPQYENLLKTALKTQFHEQNRWLGSLALAQIQQHYQDSALQNELSVLRSTLQHMPAKPRVPYQAFILTHADVELWLKPRLRQIYQQQGATAAYQYLQSTTLGCDVE